MKVYIAGRLCNENERKLLEKIAEIVESSGFETFLPHRDVGLAENLNDVEKIFRGDIINGFKNCKLVVAVLDGLHVGAGTAWELGYAYAKKIPIMGIKTDEPIEEALDSLSAILIGSMEIVDSFDKLREKLKEFSLKV